MLFFKSSTAIEYIFASGVLGEKKGVRVELMPGGLLYGSKLIC